MRHTHLITTAALVAACAVPATAAAHYGQNLQSPDTRDAATASEQQGYQDLRSPDARDATSVSESPQYSDLRSPDARDAATPAEPRQYSDLRSPDARDAGKPPVEVTQDLRSPDARDAGKPPVQVPQPVVEIRQAPGNGFDWGDAGIGAAGMFALFSIAAGVALTVGSRRRRGFGMPAH
jgi:hypothetical protein